MELVAHTVLDIPFTILMDGAKPLPVLRVAVESVVVAVAEQVVAVLRIVAEDPGLLHIITQLWEAGPVEAVEEIQCGVGLPVEQEVQHLRAVEIVQHLILVVTEHLAKVSIIR